MALLLAGCGGTAPVPKPTLAPRTALGPPETILISYGACFGTCPIFAVTVSAAGQGKFEGQNFTALSGDRAFPVSPEQFAAVAAALAPLRPADDSELKAAADPKHQPQCDIYATDHPNRIILWTGKDGKQQALVWDTGCTAKRYETVQPAIDKALAVLPVAPWIKAAD